MQYVGIDPGLGGALAILDSAGDIANVYDTPTRVEVGPRGKPRRVVDHGALRGLLASLAAPSLVTIEDVGARPTDSRVGAFTFGYGLGLWHMGLQMVHMAYHLVTPQVWKRQYGLSADKEKSRAMALFFWPSASRYFSRKKDEGRAEACLIADYGRLAFA